MAMSPPCPFSPKRAFAVFRILSIVIPTRQLSPVDRCYGQALIYSSRVGRNDVLAVLIRRGSWLCIPTNVLNARPKILVRLDTSVLINKRSLPSR